MIVRKKNLKKIIVQLYKAPLHCEIKTKMKRTQRAVTALRYLHFKVAFYCHIPLTHTYIFM